MLPGTGVLAHVHLRFHYTADSDDSENKCLLRHLSSDASPQAWSVRSTLHLGQISHRAGHITVQVKVI